MLSFDAISFITTPSSTFNAPITCMAISEGVRQHSELSCFEVIMLLVNHVVASYRNVIAIDDSKCALCITLGEKCEFYQNFGAAIA